MIREYNSADINTALELYIDCFKNPPFNYDWIRPDAIRRYFSDMERTPGFRGFVFDRLGEAAGMCLGHSQDYFACPAYDVKEFIISRAHQGCGVGTALLSGVEEVLASEGTEIILLSTSEYLYAYRFYKKNGYDVCKDTVWMGKRI